MKKSLICCLCLSLVFVGIYGVVHASVIESPWRIVASGGKYDQQLEYISDYVTWIHEFTPGLEIINGELTVTLDDDEEDSWRPKTLEVGVGWAEDGTWDIGGVEPGSYSYEVDISTLSDGEYGVTLASLGGDFSVSEAMLEITYNSNQAGHTPEPTTLLLLGSGLIGVGVFGRQFRKK